MFKIISIDTKSYLDCIINMLYFFTVQTMLSGGQIYLISMIKYIFLSLSNVSHCVLRNILRSVFVIYTEPIIKFYLPYVFLMLPSQRQMRTTRVRKTPANFCAILKPIFPIHNRFLCAQLYGLYSTVQC